MAQEVAGEQRLGRDHHEAQPHGGDEEQHVDDRAVPQRVQPVRGDQEQGPQRRLVERRQDDARDHQQQRDLLQERQDGAEQRPVEQRVLQDDRSELQGQHRQVEDHAHRDLEQHRVVLPVDHRVPDVPRQAEVVQQPHGHGGVAEERRQNGGAHEAAVLLQVEDVDRGGQHEGARGQGDARHDVEPDPEAPGGGIVEVRRRAQAVREPGHGDHRPHADDGPQDRLENSQPITHGRCRRPALWFRVTVERRCPPRARRPASCGGR